MIDIKSIIEKNYPAFYAKIPSFFKKPFFLILEKLFYQREINSFLEQNSEVYGVEFIEKILEYFNFGYKYSNIELENIPSSGKVVIVSNHPLGALDSLALISLIYSIRKDVKIVANEILLNIPQISSLLLPVDNMSMKSSKESIKAISRSLNSEEAVIIFPAGEVSRVRPTGIKDLKWKSGFLKFAKKNSAPILPIFINARNSSLFYFVSMLYKNGASLLLVSEMFNKRDKVIEIKIGGLIPIERVKELNLDEKVEVNLLKKHLYRVSKNKKGLFLVQKNISRAEDRKDLKKELNSSELLGITNDGKRIFLVEFKRDSAVLKEIGRLREFTFRRVGEGSGKKRDLDKYDSYYKHLVLWDDDELEIVGAYRIGESKTILERGVEGFYTSSLFDYKDEFLPYLDDSIELGRSFVQPKYWGSRALDYLWFGIGAYLRKYPNIKYMFGPVSLSSSYPKEVKNLILFYYLKYFGAKSEMVVSKNRYILSLQEIESAKSILNSDSLLGDFKILKKHLMHMGFSVPTLYKQYSDLCEDDGVKFLDFGVDYEFESCIDGFILVDVGKIKSSKRDRYINSTSIQNIE